MNKRHDIYVEKRNYTKEEARIDKADISEANKALIREFNEERLAQNINVRTVNKRSAQLRKIAKILEKDFKDIQRADILRLLRVLMTGNLKKAPQGNIHKQKQVEVRQLSNATKKDYWRIIKRFFRWLDKEEVLKDINPNIKEKIEIGPVITEEHLVRAVETCSDVRDKAFLWMLHESGARVGEFLNIALSDIQRTETGVRVRLDGKTGERFVPLVKCVPYLNRWLEVHPTGSDSQSFLWVSRHSKFHGKPLNYPGARKIINRAFERANITEVDYNPHHFRKSRATLYGKRLTEPLMRLYFGWAPGSDEVERYVKASGRDLEHQVLGLYNLASEPEKDLQNLPEKCQTCKYSNPQGTRYCGQCGKPMNSAIRAEDEDKYQNEMGKTLSWLQQIMSDEELLDEFKRFSAQNASTSSLE